MLNRITPTSGVDTQLLFDGGDLIAGYNASTGLLLRRYVHGDESDQPLAWYEGSGTTDRRYFYADEKGSIIAVSDASGAAISAIAYSPDGVAALPAGMRFGFTSQISVPEVGLYYFKSRFYSATLGHFLQGDPLRYGGGMNVYSYAGGDAANSRDSTGLTERCEIADSHFVFTGAETSRWPDGTGYTVIHGYFETPYGEICWDDGVPSAFDYVDTEDPRRLLGILTIGCP
jgi:RHS repeat-associated protein